jgi:acyl-CoA synthetase (AMP-forming)/AMP-acid ligase II
MKCLYERLLISKVSDVLWISDSIGSLDVARLLQVLDGFDPMVWYGQRVAIGELSTIEFVATLVFLDGLAQSIVLLPTEDDQSTQEARMTQAGIDTIIKNDGLGFSRLLAQPDNKMIAHDKIMDRPTAIQTTWLLPTSGTTGTPKLIPHTIASLTRSMRTRQIGNKYIWGSLYSLRRFAGLQVFFQSWMCGTPLILNEDKSDLYNLINRFIDLGCNALSATPSMWRKLAMHPFFERLNLRQITLGGEIVDQGVLDILAKQFPAARLTHIYASTEAGVGFAVLDGLAGFPSEYLIQAPLGVAMRIDNQNHLWFRPPSNYSLTTSSEPDWIDSGDVVELQNNRVRFLGRANGSINVGGNKVMPEEIESVIKELPDVAFVQVRARKSAILGSLVEAAITPMPGIVIDAAFRRRVTEHCRARLDSFKIPAFIVASEVVQLTSSGKLSRINVE